MWGEVRGHSTAVGAVLPFRHRLFAEGGESHPVLPATSVAAPVSALQVKPQEEQEEQEEQTDAARPLRESGPLRPTAYNRFGPPSADTWICAGKVTDATPNRARTPPPVNRKGGREPESTVAASAVRLQWPSETSRRSSGRTTPGSPEARAGAAARAGSRTATAALTRTRLLTAVRRSTPDTKTPKA